MSLGVLVSDSEMKLLMPTPKYSYSAARVKCGISQSEAEQIHTVLEPTQSWFVINPGYAQLPGIQSVIAECGAAADGAL